MGYRGRTPLYEILELNQPLRERIREQLTGDALLEGLGNLYFRTMKETAGCLMEKGITDKRELLPHIENV